MRGRAVHRVATHRGADRCLHRLDVPLRHLITADLRAVQPPVGERLTRADDHVRERLDVGVGERRHAADDHPLHRVGDLEPQRRDLLGEGRARGQLAEQHRPAVTVLFDEGQEFPGPRPQTLDGRILGVGRGLEPGEQLTAGALDVGGVQALLGLEVRVQHRLGDAGPRGDLVHRTVVEPAHGEHLAGDVEDQLLPYCSGHPAGPGFARCSYRMGRHSLETTHLDITYQ